MSQIEESDGGESTDEKDDIKPSMIEVELKVTKYNRYDFPVLCRHVHSHQKDT